MTIETTTENEGGVMRQGQDNGAVVAEEELSSQFIGWFKRAYPHDAASINLAIAVMEKIPTKAADEAIDLAALIKERFPDTAQDQVEETVAVMRAVMSCLYGGLIAWNKLGETRRALLAKSQAGQARLAEAQALLAESQACLAEWEVLKRNASGNAHNAVEQATEGNRLRQLTLI